MEETQKVVYRKTHQEYSELLKTVEWWNFSKDTIQRKGGKCEVCEAIEKLEVHHLGYKPDKLPWEYADHEVMVVCPSCHGNIHEWADKIWNQVLSCRNEWVIYEVQKAVRSTLERQNIVGI